MLELHRSPASVFLGRGCELRLLLNAVQCILSGHAWQLNMTLWAKAVGRVFLVVMQALFQLAMAESAYMSAARLPLCMAAVPGPATLKPAIKETSEKQNNKKKNTTSTSPHSPGQ